MPLIDCDQTLLDSPASTLSHVAKAGHTPNHKEKKNTKKLLFIVLIFEETNIKAKFEWNTFV